MTRTHRLSQAQMSALEQAMLRPLKHYRRGYATSKEGPFFGQSTVSVLQRNGFVFVKEGGSSARVTRAGRVLLKNLMGGQDAD